MKITNWQYTTNSQLEPIVKVEIEIPLLPIDPDEKAISIDEYAAILGKQFMLAILERETDRVWIKE